MHEQEFERSVQQKMEELSFTPSLPVWERVQQQVRPRKKRWLALWLLPLAVMLAGGSWWYLQQQYNSEPAITTGTQNGEGAVPENKTDFKNSKTEDQTAATGNSTAPETLHKTATGVQKPQGSAAGVRSFKNNGTHTVLPNRRRTLATARHQQESITENTRIFPATEKWVATAPQLQIEESPSRHANPITRITVGATKALQVSGAPFEKIVVPATIVSKEAKTHKWQWGLGLQYGLTGLSTDKVFGGSALADFSSAPSPTQSAGRPPAQNRVPNLQPGTFFSGGLLVQRRMSSKVSLQSGILYTQFSNRQRVGPTVSRTSLPNTTSFNRLEGNVFYRDSLGTSYYHNRYHFVSVPLSVQVKPFRKWPLEATAGLVAGYAVGAKSLQYDTATRLYFAATPAMQRLQWTATTGLQYRVASRPSWELVAGPQVSFNLSSLNAGTGTKKHFYAYSFGVQFRKK